MSDVEGNITPPCDNQKSNSRRLNRDANDSTLIIINILNSSHFTNYKFP